MSLFRVEDALNGLLLKLPETELDQCIQFFTSGALALSDQRKLYRVSCVLAAKRNPFGS